MFLVYALVYLPKIYEVNIYLKARGELSLTMEGHLLPKRMLVFQSILELPTFSMLEYNAFLHFSFVFVLL